MGANNIFCWSGAYDNCVHVSCGLPERTYEDVRTGSILADYLTSYFFRGADYAHKIKLVSTNTFDIPSALLMVQFAEHSWWHAWFLKWAGPTYSIVGDPTYYNMQQCYNASKKTFTLNESRFKHFFLWTSNLQFGPTSSLKWVWVKLCQTSKIAQWFFYFFLISRKGWTNSTMICQSHLRLGVDPLTENKLV